MKHVLRTTLLAAGLSALACLPARAQAPEPIKFGKIDSKDFDKAAFAGDSAANAVILCDYGRSRFDMGSQGGFVLVFDRVIRIKILKKAGYEWGDGAVMLYHKGADTEKLSNLRGFTYNLGANGEITKDKLETSAVFTEQVTGTLTRRKFTMPNVREGSVVEYAYTVTSDFLFNLQDWTFQHQVPTRWSEYRASIPEYFHYKQLWQGYEPLAVQERTDGSTQFVVRGSGGSVGGNWTTSHQGTSSQAVVAQVVNHRWATQNVPALREEPFMTTARDYVTQINFELEGVKWPNEAYRNVSGTWEKMQMELLNADEFGGQLNRGGFLKAQLSALTAQNPLAADRAAAVHALVRDNVKANGQTSLFSDAGIRKAWDQHQGNAADVNLLLIAALREAGLRAYPVILSTREHGRVDTNFPLLTRFNYVVAAVQLNDSTQVLADATEPFAPFGMLPAACLSSQSQGRLIQDAAHGSWVELNSPFRHVSYRSAQLTLDERGNLSGKLRDEQGGYRALQQRADLRQQGEKKYVENLLKQQQGWKIDKFAFQNTTTLTKPLMLDLDLRVPSEAEQPLGTIYLSLLQTLNEATNPFRLADRRFPVDFGARREETSMVTLALPAGYTVEEMPKNAVIDLPNGGGRFLFSVTPVGNSLQIMSRMTLNRSMYLADEYASLREFYERMLAKQAEKIVLKRKS
ncbi:DUF3857 domain-containing protein [Hymenobacter sp. 15J16-1T3B]|uniref:DUF3857 domain-containing protein n=1 Tax=Hymenobacter sp. 15J16-1T3B TaxID=2886941 RepID=UPI001D12EF0B|nr:DUF3857 domain-containing protein [Hymenobacter sp. 15J16-1T3B]MCC3158832.1 DUF3857 domain-containing protein [Hymenobacter sp. 15J16-1T3B]